MEAMSGKIFGIWTEEEFKDTLAIAAIVAAGTFITTVLYRAVSSTLTRMAT